MKTKAFLLGLVIMVMPSIMTSCGGNDDNGTDNPNEETVFIPSSESTIYFANGIAFSKEGGEASIQFYTNKSWRVSSTEKWCTISPQSGKAGNNVITLEVAANEQLSNRGSVVTLSIGGQNNYISVLQIGQNVVVYENMRAGTLPELLGENCMSIEELTISGELNGTDIELIRRMATTGGSLKYLNLQEARIVKGGISYTSRTVDTAQGDCYTENDHIGKCMFYALGKLETLILPRSVLVIDEFGLYFCPALRFCVLPEDLVEIQDFGLACHYELEELALPDGICHIGTLNFSSMRRLKSVTLPFNLQVIGNSMLIDCNRLEEVHIKAPVPPVAENEYMEPFKDLNIPLYVPAGSLEQYRASNIWSVFSSIIEE